MTRSDASFDGWHLLTLAADYYGLRFTALGVFLGLMVSPRAFGAVCAAVVIVHMFIVGSPS